VGYMFWTDLDYNNGQNAGVWRAWMDGSNREKYPIKCERNPTGLTRDNYNQAIYWADGSNIYHCNDNKQCKKFSGKIIIHLLITTSKSATIRYDTKSF